MKRVNFDGKISVITAVYNAENHILNLINSLRQQKDQNFEWIIIDGVSTDNTLKILSAINDLNVKIISESDFGIYDALNKGIKLCKNEYYLVVGCDDILYPGAIHSYITAIKESNYPDIITGWVDTPSGFVMKPNRGPLWLSRLAHFISCHSVGSVYRKDLHDKFGYFSKKYPIAADQLFVTQACLGGATVKELKVKVGFFNNTGVSASDSIGALTEDYRIMLSLGFNRYLHSSLFIWRLLKRLFKTQ